MEIRIFVGNQKPFKEHTVFSDAPISFTEAMKRAGLNFYRPCGGNIRCLRCGVHFLYGAPEITEEDDRAYDHTELNDGWRLGCHCILKRDCRIEVPAYLCSEIISENVESKASNIDNCGNHELAVGVDIGSTTIAVAILDINENKVLGSTSVTNSQIKYGADVMTRIESATKSQDAAKEMLSMLHKDVLGAIGSIMNNLTNIKNIAIAGNTTMGHLAAGYPVKELGTYPFTPYSLKGIEMKDKNRIIYSLPGISAFVGADIVSGIYALNIIHSKDISLFVDLGTNAEIVLWNGEKLYCTSAAAGPALEGGNISCGVASVKGAVDHVYIEKNSGKCFVTTIGAAEPIGICGSGIIDAVYEMYKAEIIDGGGLLQDEYNYAGFEVAKGVTVTAEDIQHILLAKSAIISGITVLLEQAKVSLNEIDHLYVAGGLGASLKPDSAMGLGMLPEELLGKYESVGNTSLRGTIKYLEEKNTSAFDEIISKAEVIELSNIARFEELFMENLFI